MGMFDDLIPKKPAAATGNMFADLIPQPPKPANFFDQFDPPASPTNPPPPETLSSDEFAKRYGQPAQPAPETMTPDEFARTYGNGQPKANFFDQFDDPAPAPQQAVPSKPANFFDQFDAPPAPPAPAHFNPRGAPDASTPSADQADKLAYAKDFGREVAQDALFNYGDETIAAVRAAMGEDYAKALEDEREQLKGAQERLGVGSKLAAEGLSMMMPMGPVAKVVQKLAGPGAGLLRTAAASAGVMAPVGAVSAVGGMDDKSDLAADAIEAAKGAAATAAGGFGLHAVGVPIAQAGQKIVNFGGDLVSRAVEASRYRNGNPVPLPSTTNYAIQRIADAAEGGGMRAPQDAQGAMTANAVPDTPSALVNAGNDRLIALGTETANNLQRPNVPRIASGQRVDDNLFRALQDQQATNSAGQSQAEAFRERVFDNANVDPDERDLSNIRLHDQNRLTYWGDQLADIDARPVNAPFRAGTVPGLVQAINATPDLANAYRQAARDVSIAGSRDSIDPAHIPLLPDDHDAAVAAFQNGTRATAPIALTDSNVPMPILSQMRQQISTMSANEDPIIRARGARLMSLYDRLTSGAAPSTPVGQLTNINRSMHGIHNRQEDITAGYRLPAQSGITRADAIAAARSQQPMQTAAQAVARQNDVGLGLTHGMADAAKTHESNIGALADNFANPDLRAAFDEFTLARNPQARRAQALAEELENIANMQGVSSLLRNASESRQLEPDTLPAEAARVLAKMHYSPVYGTASLLNKLRSGESQARVAETARLLTDTSGEGLQRLVNELARRGSSRDAPPPMVRTIVLNEMARQLGNYQSQ